MNHKSNGHMTSANKDNARQWHLELPEKVRKEILLKVICGNAIQWETGTLLTAEAT